MIRKVNITKDAQSICDIYNHYVVSSTISFETQPVEQSQMQMRIEQTTSNGYPYYVYQTDGRVVGYCYLTLWKERYAYQTTAELSIYVDKEFVGNGIGKLLMSYMLENVDKARFHAIVACITFPNETSISMHEKFGFTQVSHFKEVGNKFDQWQDVGHWLLLSSDIKQEESCPCGANYFCKCE